MGGDDEVKRDVLRGERKVEERVEDIATEEG